MPRALTVHHPAPHHVPLWLAAVNTFIHKNAVMCIAMTAAAVTAVIVPPDRAYAGYFDWKTLTCLFCVLAVVCALRNIRFFYLLARQVVQRFRTARMSVLALVWITFLGSMLIANDMALLTFLPLGYLVLSTTGKQKYMAFTFITQNIAANLGGMLTPFGNPQNLYLYTRFQIPNGAFLATMAPPFVLSVALITLCCVLFVRPEKLELDDQKLQLPRGRAAIYLALFALSIVIVFRWIPYWVGLAVIPPVLFFMDRKALAAVDYPLLLTFFFFFIFAGNMARIGAVRAVLGGLLARNTLVFSALSCQCISNVPSAILLSNFTGDWSSLLLGVNVGGVGTLIASLASLITFREYAKNDSGHVGRYLVQFSAFNFGFLLILLAFLSVIR